MPYKIVVDLNKITLDDFDAIMKTDREDAEGQKETVKYVKEQLWRFLVDENGAELTEKVAREEVGKVGFLDALVAVREMANTIKEVMGEAIPPETLTD